MDAMAKIPAVLVFPTPGAPWRSKIRPFPAKGVNADSIFCRQSARRLTFSTYDIKLVSLALQGLFVTEMLCNQRFYHFFVVFGEDEAIEGGFALLFMSGAFCTPF